MSLSQVTVYANQIAKQRLGYQAISLTNYDNDLEPQIAAGSKVEIGSALFEAAANESITGWGAIGNNSDAYIKLIVSGATATAAFTTTAPTWSTSKQGWYVGNDRYIGGLYKDGSGNYTKKYIFFLVGVNSIKAYGNGTIAILDALTVVGCIDIYGELISLELADFQKGVKATNTRFVPNNSEDTIFDILSPFIPTPGDKITATGGINHDGIYLIVAFISRLNATTIRFSGLDINVGIAVIDIVDGDAALMADVAIAW